MPALHQDRLVDTPLVTSLPPNQLQTEENSKRVRSTPQIDQSMEPSASSICNENLQKSKKRCEKTTISTPKSKKATPDSKTQSSSTTTSRKRCTRRRHGRRNWRRNSLLPSTNLKSKTSDFLNVERSWRRRKRSSKSKIHIIKTLLR